MTRQLVSSAALMLACACGGGGSSLPERFPLSPTSPAGPVNGQERATLSGFVFEHTPAGMKPVSGFPVRVDSQQGTIDTVTDANGRYSVQGLTREFAQVRGMPQDTYVAPCSARQWLWSDVPLNVHVLSRTNLLAAGVPKSMPPFAKLYGYAWAELMTGTVTERTPDGVRPVPFATVEHFYEDRPDSPIGFTLTTADGSYVMCAYSEDSGQAGRVRKEGYRTVTQRMGGTPFGDGYGFDTELVRDERGAR